MQYGNVNNYFFAFSFGKIWKFRVLLLSLHSRSISKSQRLPLSGIRRLLSPLFPQIKNLREPYIIKNL